MKLLDPDHPFFAPVWRRVAVVAVCLGWAILELLIGATVWAAVFGALGLWSLYTFFLAPSDRDASRKDKP